jgi:hypothetical protein
LITLIARRTIGVSANLRRFIGVGLGSSRPGKLTGLKMDGSASVLRSASGVSRPAPDDRSLFSWPPSDPPAWVACRQISRNCSATVTRTIHFSQKAKGASPSGCAFALGIELLTNFQLLFS